MAEFPICKGLEQEDIKEFLLKFRRACFIANQRQPAEMLEALPMFLEGRAHAFFNGLNVEVQKDWVRVTQALEAEFVREESPDVVWKELQDLLKREGETVSRYESRFSGVWQRWEGAVALSQARARGVGVAPIAAPSPEKDFIKMDRFIGSLDPYLRIKVQGRVPGNFQEAVRVAMEKERKVLLAATTTEALTSGITSRGEDRVSRVEKSMEKLISEFS